MKRRNENYKLVVGTIAGFMLGGMTVVGANQAINAIQNSQIKVILNGVIQTFKDESTGEVQYPITYHDRTYLPLRNVAYLAGLDVNYDSETNTAILNSKLNTYSDGVNVAYNGGKIEFTFSDSDDKYIASVTGVSGGAIQKIYSFGGEAEIHYEEIFLIDSTGSVYVGVAHFDGGLVDSNFKETNSVSFSKVNIAEPINSIHKSGTRYEDTHVFFVADTNKEYILEYNYNTNKFEAIEYTIEMRENEEFFNDLVNVLTRKWKITNIKDLSTGNEVSLSEMKASDIELDFRYTQAPIDLIVTGNENSQLFNKHDNNLVKNFNYINNGNGSVELYFDDEWHFTLKFTNPDIDAEYWKTATVTAHIDGKYDVEFVTK